MFSIFKRKTTLREASIFDGATDMHSHILFGVDDGVRTEGESLEILAHYEQLGLKSLWLTPHTKDDTPNTAASLTSVFESLKARYAGPIDLNLGSEYMMDSSFSRVLDGGELLVIDDMLLVETSFVSSSMNLQSSLQRVMSSGYFPLLAHPERYGYMTIGDYKSLRDMGVRFQLNLPSVVGLYGSEVMRCSHDLLRLGYYDHFGSDLHSNRYIDRIFDTPISRSIAQKIAQLK